MGWETTTEVRNEEAIMAFDEQDVALWIDKQVNTQIQRFGWSGFSEYDLWIEDHGKKGLARPNELPGGTQHILTQVGV